MQITEVPIVNPIAMIESACMMLDYIDEKRYIIKDKEEQLPSVIQDGKVRTYDMMKMAGRPGCCGEWSCFDYRDDRCDYFQDQVNKFSKR